MGLEPMLDMYIFETTQLIEQLEQAIINSEKAGDFSQDAINEIFRIMHTIKGSSAMMMFDNIATLAHSTEDLFYILREEQNENLDYSKLSDIVLNGIDFIKDEVEKVVNGHKPDGDVSGLISNIKSFLSELKANDSTMEINQKNEVISQKLNQQQEQGSFNIASDSPKQNTFHVVLFFEENCGMENIRAFTIVQNLKEMSEGVYHIPTDVLNDESNEIIRKEGFKISIQTTKSIDDIRKFLLLTPFLKDCQIQQGKTEEESMEFNQDKQNSNEHSPITNMPPSLKGTDGNDKKELQSLTSHQSIISVNIVKLDQLMDLVGELVIAEAMVTQNPDLKGLTLENFQKSARQLKKITGELQDIVMSIRMVPLALTFQKMNRIVRDMSKKLSKEVQLEIIGEETEVDKNIIEHISDPLMHIIRNSIDHGLEVAEERIAKGKNETGTVTLEAKNAGGDVLIIVKDDGRGLDREKILKKAKENGLVNRPESELSDHDVYSYIFSPGFSTKDKVTEFSGRGVGMDVVVKNIGTIGGTVTVDSKPDVGTMITINIPLTLAIMDGMVIRVGKSTYTIPIINIKESFRAKEEDIITDSHYNEMIMIRGECYPILRLHEQFNVKTEITNISDGIILLVESENKSLCLLADELMGEQQVVVKSLPDYIKRFKKIIGLAGCTLLGDGSISLILDITGLMRELTETG